MRTTLERLLETHIDPTPVRCPVCAHVNEPGALCKHVRWTLDVGDALDFVQFALETSPYTHARNLRAGLIPRYWWENHAEWLMERIEARFAIMDPYVFGDLGDLDLMAKDVWQAYRPEAERPAISRV